MARSTRRCHAALLLLLGALLLGQGAWIPVKAWLAQILLQRAWAAALDDGEPHRPWPWADHWPVARLTVSGQDIDLIVLEGDSANVLAFAPGHAVASGLPKEHRTVVISGHRDTHFRFLQALKIGDRLRLETPSGRHGYRVAETAIADSRTGRISVHEDSDELVLMTCYPFDAPVAGGPMRYLVRAEATR